MSKNVIKRRILFWIVASLPYLICACAIHILLKENKWTNGGPREPVPLPRYGFNLQFKEQDRKFKYNWNWSQAKNLYSHLGFSFENLLAPELGACTTSTNTIPCRASIRSGSVTDCSQSPIFPWDRRRRLFSSTGPPSWSFDASETGERTKYPLYSPQFRSD